MGGFFESLPYERFSAVMTIHPSTNKIESGPKSGLGLSVAQDMNNAAARNPWPSNGCSSIVRHQPKQKAGGYDDQQRAQSG